MSGLKTRKTSYTYTRIRDGKFYLTSDKEFTTPYDELEGLLVDLYVKEDEFGGKKIKKLCVVLEGEDGVKYFVSFNIDNYLTSAFMSFIRNANLKKAITIHPRVEAKETQNGEEVKRQTLLLSQEGKFLKGFHTKDTPNGLPRLNPLTVNGNVVWDKTDMINFYIDTVDNILRPSITGEKPTVPTVSDSKTTTKRVTKVIANDDNEDDDLPF